MGSIGLFFAAEVLPVGREEVDGALLFSVFDLVEVEGGGVPLSAALSARCFSWTALRSALLISFMLGLELLVFPACSSVLLEAEESPRFPLGCCDRPFPWDCLLGVVPAVRLLSATSGWLVREGNADIALLPQYTGKKEVKVSLFILFLFCNSRRW
jgi:hypothetical protein